MKPLLELRYHQAARNFHHALDRFHALCRKYSDSQPRAPAGQSNGGQWIAAGDPQVAEMLDPASWLGGMAEASFDAYLPTISLAGGFEKEDMGKTVQEFVSEKCAGKVRAVLPGQFLEITIEDLLKMKGAEASRCRKILKQDRFRK